MAITVTYVHNPNDLLLGYILTIEDFHKLRDISNFLHSMEKCDADARRDLGHKMWLILNRVEESEVH